MNSILTSIKKLLGLPEDYECFDQDIIIHINSAFATLNQLGVGPKDGFVITDKNSVWSEFTSNNLQIESVKSYVYLSVRLIFDPPTSGILSDSLTRQKEEIGWRLNAAVDRRSQNGNN